MQEALYQEPVLLLKSDDFTSLEVETVNWLLQRDDLGMSELDLWLRLVIWGIDPEVTKYTDEEFDALEKILRPCIPYVRWHHIPAAEFRKQVSIFKRLLQDELHDPDVNGSQAFYASPIYSTVASRIQSVLINPDQAARIASWINRLDITLLENVRGSRDQKFLQHTLTSNQVVVIIKPSNSSEILGGYNPLSWSKKSISSNKEPQNTAPLKDSFVFSLGSDEKSDILSRVIDLKDSIYCNVYCSPVFGKGDLFPKGHFEIGQPCGCEQTSYEKPLRQSADQFIIEEFEVFQVIKKEY
ncbi:6373_t:CDS:2 [Dentiscutata erythropus]|uniref:6373_t:CDS:1 n=1 Tax=Dentiscutata erythropus TaxID=1348616 RepID=A0A9N9F2A3_9GLOM|nr:6373_t:CDS:2 [Dentiscutata erythropus]